MHASGKLWLAAIALLVAALVSGHSVAVPAPAVAPRDWQTKESCGMWSDTVRRGANLRASKSSEGEGVPGNSLLATPADGGFTLPEDEPCEQE